MRFYISHRGNLYGRIPKKENEPGYIVQALHAGFHCEIDVWYLEEKGFYLGHDEPQYYIPTEFIVDPRLWCHAKNEEAFITMLSMSDVCAFWHDKDRYALTSDGYIWTWPGTEHNKKCIIVHPEISPEGIDFNNIAGVCSDYVGGFKR